MIKGYLLFDNLNKHNYYQIERIGKKTILLKVYDIVRHKKGYFIEGKQSGYYVRESRDKIEKELGKRYFLRW
jgi:hypothetical protein